MDTTGVELKAVRLELPKTTHNALRVEAARQDKSMAALVRALVEDFLFKPKKGKGVKPS